MAHLSTYLSKEAAKNSLSEKKIKELVKKYGKMQRKRTILGYLGLADDKEMEFVPGRDLINNVIDENYFRPGWRPSGFLMRIEGPDPLGRFPDAAEAPYGTIFYT